jgi:hypothetical protein
VVLVVLLAKVVLLLLVQVSGVKLVLGVWVARRGSLVALV